MNARILIAEDDYEDRYLMTETFKEIGHDDSIFFVEDGIALIDHLASVEPATVGLIILDLNMPRRNGTETLRHLKEMDGFRNIPIIIFSTSVNEIEKRICLQLGAYDYITKPSKYSEYIDTCRTFQNISTTSVA